MNIRENINLLRKTDFYRKLFINSQNEINQEDFEHCLKFVTDYEKLPIFNVAVCATMSAGKSTFINAILEDNLLPSGNQATTAKITSIYGNNLKEYYLKGFSTNNEKILSYSLNISSLILKNWNFNRDVTNVYLQGDMPNLRSDQIIPIINDTPGVNNSSDRAHHDITIDFLRKNIDCIVFIGNLNQSGNDDEEIFLKEVYEIIKNRNIPILFVLNKADDIDFAKDDIKRMISDFKNHISKIGFTDYKVFPTSSNAAKLFKMALGNKVENLTEVEIDELFGRLYSKFVKRMNLTNEIDYKIPEIIPIDSNECIEIGGVKYPYQGVSYALFNTGFLRIENELKNIMVSTTMKYCTECGTELYPNAKWCTHCGVEIDRSFLKKGGSYDNL